jgi:hypothetical protein
MPCDFFLWGWAMDKVYCSKWRNMDEEMRISCVLSTVPVNMLGAVWKTYLYD